MWYGYAKDIKLVRILISKSSKRTYSMITSYFPHAAKGNSSKLSVLCNDINAFLDGRPVGFSLKYLDQSYFKDFQRRVILLERKIPRGKVSTYGRLALKLGCPRAARGVGQALANNPFPIIIPCHRTIRSDGSLGGYIGGLSMKRKLLELEGIKFDHRGRVITKKFW